MKLPPDGIIKAIARGMGDANGFYEKLSTEWINDRGVESFIASHLAKSLIREDAYGAGTRVILEMSCREFQDWYAKGKRPRGRRGRHLNYKNRLDVVVLTSGWRPLLIVELKNSLRWIRWKSDVERVASFVRRYSVPAGAFAVFLSERKGDTPEITPGQDEVTRFAGKQHGVKCVAFDMPPTSWKNYEGERWRWGIAGVLFTRV